MKPNPRHISEFTRKQVLALRADIAKALLPVEIKYNIVIRGAGGSWTSNNMTMKFTASVKSTDGDVQSPEIVAFRQSAFALGLQPTDLGREFRHRGTKYKLVGYHSRRPKFPMVGERVTDGKRFKFPIAAVLAGIIR